ncbi:Vacuolar protein sorting-associated protein SNF8 [Clydaea vesicula]|uniref:Vacuolar protein sorting-associated protein SNF8 n=1 Tax=Clydaea vesicula TaxID=447962 RepID=A0AAD5U876_9FUNG|nr:Vacuolar protein sorting-associated protein SNF8 [Clydaea vesicula]
MRRGAGISGIQKKQQTKTNFNKVAKSIQDNQIQLLQTQLSQFQINLEKFAAKHKNDIKKDPVFRAHFQQMCSKIGVDPLASNKGFWAEFLGVGDFYYELAVQVIQVCLATKASNGGLIEINELRSSVEKMRGNHLQSISNDDIIRSIKTLSPLVGKGCYTLIDVGDKTLIQSLPREFNMDYLKCLEVAEVQKFI